MAKEAGCAPWNGWVLEKRGQSQCGALERARAEPEEAGLVGGAAAQTPTSFPFPSRAHTERSGPGKTPKIGPGPFSGGARAPQG